MILQLLTIISSTLDGVWMNVYLVQKVPWLGTFYVIKMFSESLFQGVKFCNANVPQTVFNNLGAKMVIQKLVLCSSHEGTTSNSLVSGSHL